MRVRLPRASKDKSLALSLSLEENGSKRKKKRARITLNEERSSDEKENATSGSKKVCDAAREEHIFNAQSPFPESPTSIEPIASLSGRWPTGVIRTVRFGIWPTADPVESSAILPDHTAIMILCHEFGISVWALDRIGASIIGKWPTGIFGSSKRNLASCFSTSEV